jgi:peptidoglycan/LPS O-acetylase OafA/YrhL
MPGFEHDCNESLTLAPVVSLLSGSPNNPIRGWNVKNEHAANLLELRRETASDALAPRTSSKHKHLPALDGVRGFAVLMVFLVHYGGGAKSSNFLLHTIGVSVQAGWSGVTLFFILSGFLISGIIWDARDDPRFWRNFYMRRTLRIFPIYYASLLLVVITAAVVGNAVFALKHVYVYALYLQNVPLPFGAGNLGSPLELSHFWSLAVEEQFYLLWPFLLTRMKTLDQAKRLCIAIFVFSAAFRIVAWYFLPAPPDAMGIPSHRIFHGAYGFTLSRAGELAAGAYLAMSYRDPVLWQRLRALAPYVCVAGLAGFLIAAAHAHTLTDECAAGFMAGLPCITICLAALLVMALDNGFVNRVFRIGTLRWLGGISYGFYIFHVLFTPLFGWIVTKIAPDANRNVVFGLNFIVAGSLSVLLAWLSFRFFESRFLRRRSLYKSPQNA